MINYKKYRWFVLLGVLIFQYLSVPAQSDSIQLSIDPITISVTKIESPLYIIPSTVTNIFLDKSVVTFCPAQPRSIHEIFNHVPGLFSLNPNNHAQDVRISIRGFGARSAFGIRGIKIIVDGIPETTPDGQGQVDNIDLGLLESVQIIRGPSSGLYGNASGGVISLGTQKRVDKNFVELTAGMGSYDLFTHQLKSGWKKGNTHLVTNISHAQSNGYRDQNAMEQSMISGSVFHTFKSNSVVRFNVNYTHSPIAQDPGGIDIESVQSNRRAAREQNKLFDVGESIKHFKTSLSLEYAIHDFYLNSHSFYSNRDFEGFLPFTDGGNVALSRNYMGQGLTLAKNTKGINWKGKVIWENQFQGGGELLYQRDNRKRFDNEEGKRGNLSFDQIESFLNTTLFITDHFTINPFVISADVRFDWNKLEAKDQFLPDGDDSGGINMNALSSGVSVGYKIKENHLWYLRFSSSFETPALSELSSNPDGSQGFNETLKPQSSHNFEMGLKGVFKNKFHYEMVGFYIQTKDEITSFENAQFPGRSFFRNAGMTQRLGLETSFDFVLTKSFRSSVTYTLSDFTFKAYQLDTETLEGQKLPGIPDHYGALSFVYDYKSKILAGIRNKFVGSLFTNDNNSVSDKGYFTANFFLNGHFTINKLVISPFLECNNIFNSHYNDNIRINAFGGRYYEPAPVRNVYFGLGIRI